MTDPLEVLLVETEGIYLVQAADEEPVCWFATLEDARTEARRQAMVFGKAVYVFRAIAKVKPVDSPVRWTELVAHGRTYAGLTMTGERGNE